MTDMTIFYSQFQKDGTTLETFAEIMGYMREHPGTTLVIEPGIYHITSNLAKWTMESVLSGDFGLNPQRTMFNPKFPYTKGIDFNGQKGSRVIANGVTLMVEGFMEPVSLNNCEDIEIIGLTIDHKRKPYGKGVVTAVNKESKGMEGLVMVEFSENSPVSLHTPLSLRCRFYDQENRVFLPLAGRPMNAPEEYFVDPFHCVFRFPDVSKLRAGVEFYTLHTYHYRPAILIENARNIRLTDVTIHSQPGMGIVGNRSEDVFIKRLSIVPSCGEHWSTNTDATHFTSMKGILRFENCISEAHGDDFVNVHTYYQDIVKRESGTVCYMQEKTPDGTHAQSLDYPDVGDTLELTSRESLQTVDKFTVIECVPMPEQWMCRVTLDHPLPENTDGYVLADVTRLPRLEIVGCTISAHFARSILIKTRDVLVERNFIKNALEMAIEVAAEASWYEGVCPADIVIRGNRIVDCGGREAAGIVVKADCAKPIGQSIFNVTIEDNIIEVPHENHAIFIRNTDGVTVRRNQICCKAEPVIFEECTNMYTAV